MHNGKRIFAVIPARGGSKGLPGKNTRELAGKPLLAWSIDAARHSRFVDEVIVSTDCEATAQLARSWGADVPFIRPAELATDEAKGIDVILHALNWRQLQDPPVDLVLVLQPTSPLRTSTDIDQAVALLFARKAQSIVSVCPVEHHPWWANTLPEDGSMKDFLRPELNNTNRQELPSFYRLNGAIYLAQASFLQQTRSFIAAGTYGYQMPPEASIDIDTLLDFRLAELLLTERRTQRQNQEPASTMNPSAERVS